MMDTLTELRRANIARQAEWGGSGEPLPVLFKAAELGGEVGEALNVVKKLERERLRWSGSRATVGDLADELADVIICVDLLAEAYGINVGHHVIRKFNETSRNRGLSTMMEGEIKPCISISDSSGPSAPEYYSPPSCGSKSTESLSGFGDETFTHEEFIAGVAAARETN